MEISNRIRSLMDERQWNEYRLIKESGIPASTIANIFHRSTIPTVPTLERICTTFGITLSQFFSEGNMVALTDEQMKLLNRWATLNEEQKQALISLLEKMN